MQRWSQEPAKHLRWSFSRDSFLGLHGNSESCQTSKMEISSKIAKNKKPFTIFVRTSILDVWQCSGDASEFTSKVRCFILKSVWISKVTDNLLLAKIAKKETKALHNSWTKTLLNRTNSYIFAHCAVKH